MNTTDKQQFTEYFKDKLRNLLPHESTTSEATNLTNDHSSSILLNSKGSASLISLKKQREIKQRYSKIQASGKEPSLIKDTRKGLRVEALL